MNIPLILNILTLAVLIFISAQLSIIARGISRGITILLKERKIREEKSSGQTINVHVTPTGTITGTPTVTSSTLSSQENSVSPPEVAKTEEKSPDPPKETPKVSKGIPDGPLAVKCPRCHMENSRYRRECFNCGEPL